MRHKLNYGCVKLILIPHRGRTTFEVADVRPLLRNYQRPLELPRAGGVHTEIRRQLERTPHALRDVAEGAVRKHRGVECGKEVVVVRYDRTEVLFDQLGMIKHSFRERAENDAVLGERVLESRGHRYAVKHRVNRHTRQQLLLLKRNTELFKGLENFRVYFVETLELFLRLGRRVVGEGLIIDGRIGDIRPRGLRHLDPITIRLEPPLQHELGLLLLFRDRADDVFVQPLRDGIGIDVRHPPVLVWLAYLCLDHVIPRQASLCRPP